MLLFNIFIYCLIFFTLGMFPLNLKCLVAQTPSLFISIEVCFSCCLILSFILLEESLSQKYYHSFSIFIRLIFYSLKRVIFKPIFNLIFNYFLFILPDIFYGTLNFPCFFFFRQMYDTIEINMVNFILD